MPKHPSPHISPPFIFRNFGGPSASNAADRSILARLDAKPKRLYPADSKLSIEGAPIRPPYIIASGWACRARVLDDGRRQIVSLLVPGSLVGFSYGATPISHTAIYALTSVRTVDATDLQSAWRARREDCEICAAISEALAEDEYFLAQHVTRLGRQTARERMAHLFLELNHRLGRSGATPGSFLMPITQEMLADVLGLSVVHVNRTLQSLRRDGLIELSRNVLRLVDSNALTQIAEFKPPPVQPAATPVRMQNSSVQHGNSASIS